MAEDATPESRIAAECLAGRVRILNRLVSNIYDDVLRPYNVRISQMNVLVTIAARDEICATDICRLLQLEKSTLSRDLDRLLENGWVRTKRVDKRTQYLEATEAGRALIRNLAPDWEVAQARARELLGATLSKEILKTVVRLRAE
jgi:DNA-binding MarR family transcriptional regulator